MSEYSPHHITTICCGFVGDLLYKTLYNKSNVVQEIRNVVTQQIELMEFGLIRSVCQVTD